MPKPLRWLTAVALTAAVATTGCSDDPTGTDDEDTQGEQAYPEVRSQLGERFGDQVTSFKLREMSVGELYSELEEGTVRVPLANPENEIREVEFAADRIQLRVPGLEEGVQRSGAVTDPSVERVSLPPEQNFVLGTCEGGEGFRCGAVTVLDDSRTLLAGVFIHPETGTTFAEPVRVILDDLPEGTPEGLHVLYNQSNTKPIEYPDEEAPEGSQNATGTLLGSTVAPSHDATGKQTEVVLDGDVRFYQQDPSTVWRRQEFNMFAARLVFAYVEPNSGSPHRWGLDLRIKGQEVWISGGPNSTNSHGGVDLENTLEDPDYFTIHNVESDEMLIFYVGYEVGHTQYWGRAGGIPGGNATQFGGGTRDNRAWVKDMPRLSLGTVWGVSMHEVGHLMGGRHSDGCSNCSSGRRSGMSIMPSGKATLDTRDWFFSDANDANIAEVLNSVLP